MLGAWQAATVSQPKNILQQLKIEDWGPARTITNFIAEEEEDFLEFQPINLDPSWG